MSNRLDRITDWTERARKANYCVRELAVNCDVSLSTLGRWFRARKAACPEAWLREERHCQALALLLDGTSVKETAILLGYKTASHFSREFKRRTGYPPREHLSRSVSESTANGQMACIDMKWRA